MQPLQSGSTMKLGDRPSAAPSAVTQHGALKAPAAFPLVGHRPPSHPQGCPAEGLSAHKATGLSCRHSWFQAPCGACPRPAVAAPSARGERPCPAPPSPGPGILSDHEQEAPARPWRGLQVLPGLREGQGARALPGARPASSRRSCPSCPSLGLLQPQPLHRGPWVHLPPALLPG